MITLYHGSDMAVERPLVAKSRRNLDFGCGFYLTSIPEQAEKWAAIVSSRRSDDITPVVSVYTLDIDAALADGYKHLVFPSYNMDWLDFVVRNRQGLPVEQEYDFVEGGVANDQVIDTVEDYEVGRITADQALDQLKYKHPNHQLCICNQQLIDTYLHYEGFRTLA